MCRITTELHGFRNLGFRKISASCTYVTRNIGVSVGEVVSP